MKVILQYRINLLFFGEKILHSTNQQRFDFKIKTDNQIFCSCENSNNKDDDDIHELLNLQKKLCKKQKFQWKFIACEWLISNDDYIGEMMKKEERNHHNNNN